MSNLLEKPRVGGGGKVVLPKSFPLPGLEGAAGTLQNM